MGRPPKPAEDKRQLVSVRLDPSVRRAFEAGAQESGRSLAAEVEYRAGVLAGVDRQTVQFVDELVREITALERRHPSIKGHKSWHRNLRIWSAVAEMMAEGPIMDWKPSNEVDMEAQTEAWGPMARIVDEQLDLVRQLSNLGVTVQMDERKFGGNGLGLLGGESFSSRTLELAAIEALPDNDAKRCALQFHQRLRDLDREVEEAREKWAAEMQPYWNQEAGGRQDYRDYLHSVAVEKRERGEPFDFAHLMKWFLPKRS